MADVRGKMLFFSFVITLTLSCALTVPGGWRRADENAPTVKSIADFAAQELDARSNSMFRSKLLTVTHAQTQVVAGLLYKLQFDFGETECRKGDNSRQLEDCPVHKVRECTVKILDQVWLNKKTVQDFRCDLKNDVPKDSSNDIDNSPQGEPKPMIGGPTKISSDGDEVLAALDYAVNELNAKSNSMYRAMRMKVKDVTSQVVAGIKYTIVVVLGMSKCRNSAENKQATLEQCPVPENSSEAQECTFEVWDQAWQDPRYQLLSTSCVPVHGEANSQPMLGGDGHDIGNYGMFEDFKTKFNRQYATKDEEKMRYKQFHKNMMKAKKLQDSEQGTAIYGASKYADLTEDEYRTQLLTPEWDTSHNPLLQEAEIPTGPAPASFDWRDHNAVSPVKNQGACGSCWAFSTTGNIEGQWAIRKQKLLSLSEQELVDCDKLDDGCMGGLPSNAYQSIMKLGGLETESEYPYEGRDDKCAFNVSDIRVYINGSVNISKSEDDMAAWLAQNGPISIGINAFAMQFYMGGIAHPWKIFCNPSSLDHGVLIVGYGVQNDTPYWIIKNSWGEDWGEKGYYLVYRGGGVCGLNTMCTSAVVN